MALSSGRIRDPVHGYVAFTAIERAVLDHPIAQRLRHISQSAAAHLVFPEMRVSRFAHSTGAMHLASRFLKACLDNAEEAERTNIIAACHRLVEAHQGLGLGPGWEPEHGLITGRDLPPNDREAVLLVEQGLRLASLVHDLGHLPFSHDFEHALEVWVRQEPGFRDRYPALFEHGPTGDKIHERVGYALANVVQEQVFNTALAGTRLAKPAEVSLLIARDLLNAPAAPELVGDEQAAVVSWLHSLIAGEIDVDRSDYVLPDVRHYGLTAAGFDVDRLTDNLTPIRVGDGRIVTGVLPQGVSAAESFLVARFRLYAWAIYHHKVQQAAAGLRVALADLLESGNAAVVGFLEDIAQVAAGAAHPAAIERFADSDDSLFFGLMRERLRDGAPELVVPWLALFTQRRPGPVSLWKRAADFPTGDTATWNRRLPDRDDLEREAAWAEIRTAAARDGILIERLPFRPYDTSEDGESELLVRGSEGAVPLTRLSSLVRALDGAWMGELQVYAFADRADRITREEVIQRLEPALKPEEEA
jgi:HD superfamily phosphohydrolase